MSSSNSMLGFINTMLSDKQNQSYSLFDGIYTILSNIKDNSVFLSETDALWDFSSNITGKTTDEQDTKCQELIKFVDTFNGVTIKTKNIYEPDFIEVTNKSNMKHKGDYTVCNIDFRLNILPAKYVLINRPDLISDKNHDE